MEQQGFYVKIIHSNGSEYILPLCAGYNAQQIDIDDKGERANGYVYRNRIRQDVWRVNIEWERMTMAELQPILKALKPAEFTAVFIVPEEGFYRSAQMMAGDRVLTMNRDTAAQEPEKAHWDLSVAIVEY